MKLIKSAIIYKCELPHAELAASHFEENKFTEILAQEVVRIGFEPMFENEFVTKFERGYAFKVRLDEKTIPSTAIGEELHKRCSEIEERESRKLPNKERAKIKDEIIFELIPRAIPATKRITCFYRPEDSLLIVPTTSNKFANAITGKLVKAIGSIKTTTIHVDGIKQSFTQKLSDYLAGNENSFSGLKIGGTCKLKGEEGKAAAFKMHDIEEAKQGIKELIDQDASVVEIELENDDVYFKINSDFIMKNIGFIGDDETEFESELEKFQHEASVSMLLLSNTIKSLVDMFSYKEAVSEH